MTEERDMNGKPDKDLAYYLHLIRNNPKKAIGLVVLGIIVAIVWGFGNWITGKTENLLQQAWEKMGYGEGEKEEGELWELAFSTGIPHCLTGRISEKLRDWTITWESGADRLVICADGTIKAPKAQIPSKLQERFPDCLTIESADKRITVKTELDSKAICRAPYRFNATEIQKTNLARGIFLCFSGADVSASETKYTFDGSDIPVCNETILKNYNFIEN